VEKDAKICIAGEQTLIGAGLQRQLVRQGYVNLVSRSAHEPTWSDAAQVDSFFAHTAPEYVFLVAGRSGGIAANQRYPADLMRDNLLAACHVLHSACRYGVKKVLYLASSCSYPRHCPQPMREEALFTGPLEPTNAAYAMAKLAGIALCEAYRQQYGVPIITAIPANSFGPGDDFSPEHAHVIPALIRKMHIAKVRGAAAVEIWGSGNPRREFLFVDDLADACLFIMRHYDEPQPINLGGGTDLSIREVAMAIKDLVGYRGALQFDPSKPDGMPGKVLDSSRLRAMGWRPRTPFPSALSATYAWFLHRQAK
jgi:GDP-L-fucose synthase